MVKSIKITKEKNNKCKLKKKAKKPSLKRRKFQVSDGAVFSQQTHPFFGFWICHITAFSWHHGNGEVIDLFGFQKGFDGSQKTPGVIEGLQWLPGKQMGRLVLIGVLACFWKVDLQK